MKTEITVQEIKDRCLASFADFCELMQDDGWFEENHRNLCNFCQYWYEHDTALDIDVLIMIVLPRGTLKSTIVTKYLPSWITLKRFYENNDCSTRSLIATNTATNATSKLKDIQGLFDGHKLFRVVFPEILPTSNEQWSTAGLKINQEKATTSVPEATFTSAGVGTRLTGSHYNIIIEDDTTAPDESDMEEEVTIPSQETISKAIGFHKAAVPLFVPQGVRVSIVVTTRWADEDLVTYLQKHEDYHVFNLPAIQKVIASDGTEVIEYSFPNIYGYNKLKQIEKRVGEYMFSCLYLNSPVDPSRRIFQKSWFKYTPISEVPSRGFCTIAIDPAISENNEACETAITAVQHVDVADGKDPAELPIGSRMHIERHQYWWKDIHSKLLPSEQIDKTINLAVWMQRHVAPVKAIIVEKVAYQAALKFLIEDELRRRGLHFNVVGYGTRSSKNARIESLQPHFMNCRIHFVENQLTDQVESQLIQYPHGKLIDIIDSFTLHKAYWQFDKLVDETPICKQVTPEEELLAFITRNKGRTVALPGYDEFAFMNMGMKTGLGAERDLAHLVNYS